MSYLDFPRINFTGLFQALPSTVNNSPLNYEAGRWEKRPANPNQPTDKIALYWSPNGTGIFDLVECQVTSALHKAPSPDEGSQEDLLGVPVAASYTKAPPKIVDLDPMQQNVSAIWGMRMRIGHPDGPNVTGDLAPVAFNGIWQKVQGAEAPHSSASGGAVFQSSLTNLRWNTSGSPVLEALQEVSKSRLSIRMVVSAHNNNPQKYLFNQTTLRLAQTAPKKRVPKDVIQKLQVLTTYQQQSTEPPGQIPTSSYVLLQLRLLLGEELALKYGQTILDSTQQPYTAATPNEFGYGNIIGSVGPATESSSTAAKQSEKDEGPLYVVPARSLAPPPLAQGEQPPSPNCYFAPAKLHAEEGILTVDLGNSLPVNFPGDPPLESLGELSLGYSPKANHFVTIAENIPFTAGSGLLSKDGGIVDVTGLSSSVVQALQCNPLVLRGTAQGKPTTLLMEDRQGLSIRADQFVYRMNPGIETSPTNPRGETAELKVYVRKFGEVDGTQAYEVNCSVLSPETAYKYTSQTAGTSGTPGLEDISKPEGKLTFVNGPKAPIENGVASFVLKAGDPGDPRGPVDGQVYFVKYSLSPSPGSDFVTDANNLVSVHIYQKIKIKNSTCENGILKNPAYEKEVRKILTQYGRLYPIMTNIGLSDLETVKKNAGMIYQVLSLDINDPLHMPVTRDLSESRRKILLDWLAQFISSA